MQTWASFKKLQNGFAKNTPHQNPGAQRILEQTQRIKMREHNGFARNHNGLKRANTTDS